MRNFAALFFASCVCLGGAGALRAETTVQVLATEPAGRAVTLGRGETFYLRIAYRTEEPVGIWAQPYFQGQPARAGTNPSGSFAGSGEALGWFFLLDPDARVDEVRIRVGDGSRSGTRVLATYPVRVDRSSAPAAATAKPAWVTELTARAEAEQRAAYERRLSEPETASGVLLFGGFMVAVCIVSLLGFAGPAWGLWRWKGGWRIAAAVPAVMMAFVVLRIVVGVAADPSSHNLWPFELLQTGLLSTAIFGVSMLARRLTGSRRP